jgi:putative hemolysin
LEPESSEPPLYLLGQLLLQVDPGAGQFAMIILLLAILLICSALVSGSEVAFFSLKQNMVDQLSEEKLPSSVQILELLNKPRYLLATILIANNFINIVIIIISTIILSPLRSIWNFDPVELGSMIIPLGDILLFTFEVVIVTFILVLFGEVAPKVYANSNPVKLARVMSGPLSLLNILFRPLSAILVNSTMLIERKLGNRMDHGTYVSLQEIDQAIDMTVGDRPYNAREVNILKSIVKFGHISVKQIMRSRVDVIAVDFKTTLSELISTIKESGYSRIPVYDETFDSVTGILYVKDLVPLIDEVDENYEWQTLIREAFFVPDTKKIDDLLREFQAKRIHLAIVVDEYGGTLGIVSLEDIMEEIIGEIRDEFDDLDEIEFRQIDNSTFIFEGKTMLNDACRVMNIETNTFDEVKGESESLAGMLLEIVGRFPKINEEIKWQGFVFKVVSMSNRRIEEIKIIKPS